MDNAIYLTLFELMKAIVPICGMLWEKHSSHLNPELQVSLQLSDGILRILSDVLVDPKNSNVKIKYIFHEQSLSGSFVKEGWTETLSFVTGIGRRLKRTQVKGFVGFLRESRQLGAEDPNTTPNVRFVIPASLLTFVRIPSPPTST